MPEHCQSTAGTAAEDAEEQRGTAEDCTPIDAWHTDAGSATSKAFLFLAAAHGIARLAFARGRPPRSSRFLCVLCGSSGSCPSSAVLSQPERVFSQSSG
jgi:hypothetical protein